ncbi:hypothetical protein P154DRAFT_320288 [Amniculicola lignicola CBS 123094]|uniref:Uncharacterized protein n=1 Tax=Amniculicola lignicola CBS 123094 TaxID=1392246 RepID=A0A6A5W3G6_9PLEO|nr:hypothetical protein P154DRAFT_320288 [Amniculicola lignicola CBS 123094]
MEDGGRRESRELAGAVNGEQARCGVRRPGVGGSAAASKAAARGEQEACGRGRATTKMQGGEEHGGGADRQGFGLWCDRAGGERCTWAGSKCSSTSAAHGPKGPFQNGGVARSQSRLAGGERTPHRRSPSRGRRAAADRACWAGSGRPTSSGL